MSKQQQFQDEAESIYDVEDLTEEEMEAIRRASAATFTPDDSFEQRLF